MIEEKYNGWKNRETWLVPLWWNECPVDSIQAETTEDAIESLAEQLETLFKQFAEERFETDSRKACLFTDLFAGASSKIDWRKIAEHWIDDIEVVLH